MVGQIYQRAREVLEAEVGDELVALDVKAGVCFGFNQVARSIWRCLAEPQSFERLRDALLAEYEVGMEQCTEEVQVLLGDLADKGLVEFVTE